MTTKTKIVIYAVSIATAVAIGRYSAPEKVRVETKTVTVEKKVESVDKEHELHKKTTITETQKPDGTKETKTVITYDSNTHVDGTTIDDKNTTLTSSKEVTKSSSNLNVYGLVGTDFKTPVYGGHISREVIGPISLGAWALTNRTVGFSLGLRF